VHLAHAAAAEEANQLVGSQRVGQGRVPRGTEGRARWPWVVGARRPSRGRAAPGGDGNG
jgi:hypothetical protein